MVSIVYGAAGTIDTCQHHGDANTTDRGTQQECKHSGHLVPTTPLSFKGINLTKLAKGVGGKNSWSSVCGLEIWSIQLHNMDDLCFLVNFTITVWGAIATQNEKDVSLQGDCDRVRRLNTGLHVLINILSTLLLNKSNYCMQVCSAPTRRDINRAHGSAYGIWLDIEIPGIRNLRYISRRRTILWCLLGLSLLPLHLL